MNYRYKNGKVHALHELILPGDIWVMLCGICFEDELDMTTDPVTCKTCLRILAKRGDTNVDEVG